MKIVVIVQARLGSTRLPGKVLMDIGGRSAIELVFERIKQSKLVNDFWLATSTSVQDGILAEWAKKYGIKYCRGSESDVLDRYYQTAVLAKADVIVRITGDCPLHDYKIIDLVVQSFIDNPSCDYVSNTNPPTYPDGLDVEVFSMAALKKAHMEADLQSEREHVTPFIRTHHELFKTYNVVATEDYSNLRWTLDTAEDLELIRKIYSACKDSPTYCGLQEMLKIIEEHPDWSGINKNNKRNEGYLKSLLEDKI